MVLRKTDPRAFAYFGIALRVLALLHALQLVSWKYYLHDPEQLFKIPILPVLGEVPALAHQGIFLIFVACSLLFAFTRRNAWFSFGISACYLYFLLHDRFSFHHDIFLAANIFFLFGLCQLSLDKRNGPAFESYVNALKVLATIVYLASGLHKINIYFHDGTLIKNLLELGVLRHLSLDESILWPVAKGLSIFTIIAEIGVPILIWTRFRWVALYLACGLSFGISFFAGRGILFNSYLPLIMVLFFRFGAFECSVKPWVYGWVKRLDVLHLCRGNDAAEQSSVRSVFLISRNVLALNPLFLCGAGLVALRFVLISLNTLFP